MKYLLAILSFFMFVVPAQALPLPKCADVPIIIDHPAYLKILKFVGAAYDPTENMIALSTKYMDTRPPNVRSFIFAHECGHSQLMDSPSHKLPPGNLQAEIDADAYAVKVMKEKNIILSESEIAIICMDVGSTRCEAIRRAIHE